MKNDKSKREFIALNIAVLTISDTRKSDNDVSGNQLVELLEKSGHSLSEKVIVKDDIYQIRSVVSKWISDLKVDVVLTTGGTGVTGRDGTPEAIEVLLDKKIEGFGLGRGWPRPDYFFCLHRYYIFWPGSSIFASHMSFWSRAETWQSKWKPVYYL